MSALNNGYIPDQKGPKEVEDPPPKVEMDTIEVGMNIIARCFSHANLLECILLFDIQHAAGAKFRKFCLYPAFTV